MLPDLGIEYYIFGSKDSLDTDVLIISPKWAVIEKDSDLIWSIIKENYLIKYPFIDEWKPNFISIVGGFVTDSISSKGSIDSVNNSLYETYSLHEQLFALPIKAKMKRDINAAVLRCLERIFTFYKHSPDNKEYYKSIPTDIKNGTADLNVRLARLNELDLNLTPKFKKGDEVGEYKRIAFLIGQTISLLNGIEIYTKEDLIKHHEDLTDIINRVPINSYVILNEKCKLLASSIRNFK